MEDLIKGYITLDKRRGNYMVKFYNPLIFNYEYIGSSKDYFEVYNMYSNKQVYFYKEHKYLIPKSIQLDSKQGIFKVGFSKKDKFGRVKQIHISSNKTLEEAIDSKLEFIKRII